MGRAGIRRQAAVMALAFVFSGGASLGAAQAGMLHALYERGLRPDLVVGTSVGAINAAFAASRPPTVAAAEELATLWRRVNRGDVFPVNPLIAGLGLLGVRAHAVPNSALRRLLSGHCGVENLEDAAVALHVVAADLLTGEEVLLSDGPAVEALLASAAIPGIFAPVERDGRLLVDGGIVNNAPISHAVELGADRVIVLPAIGPRRLSQAPRGVMGAALAGISRAIGRRFDEDVERFGRQVELTVLPAPVSEIMPTDFGHAGELIDDALTDARRALARTRTPLPRLRAA
jgi:NTE family protein